MFIDSQTSIYFINLQFCYLKLKCVNVKISAISVVCNRTGLQYTSVVNQLWFLAKRLMMQLIMLYDSE